MNSGAGGARGAAAGRMPAGSLRQSQWRLADERCELREEEMEYMRRFHRHEIGSNQCNSFIGKHVRAPLQNILSLRVSMPKYHLLRIVHMLSPVTNKPPLG
uniref:Uncharacterized protein n=1 Tax=Oryza meridionalis TaxID=40149 RepID=A0A0E0E2G4_9ORYZ